MEKSELIEKIIELRRNIDRVLRKQRPDIWMKLGMTIAQLKSMFFIANEGSTNSSKLAAALGVTLPNVTGIIDRLVEQGFISRRENPDDRRIMILEATQEGKALLSELRESNIGYMSKALVNLSLDELSVVVHGLTLMMKALESHQEESKDEHD